MTIYIGFVSFSINHSEFCVYDEQFVTEITRTFTDEESATEWVKAHGTQFVDRRGDNTAVVAENTETDKNVDKTFFAVKINEVGKKQRVRISDFCGHYSE